MAKKDTNLVIRFDSEAKKELEILAKESRRTPSDYVRLLIDDAIKNKTKV
jgi:predicted DNA-binding protein